MSLGASRSKGRTTIVRPFALQSNALRVTQ